MTNHAAMAEAIFRMVQDAYKVSLKDAARELGVSPSSIRTVVRKHPTLLRIEVCREWDSQARVSARASRMFGGAGSMLRNRAYIFAARS